MLSPIIFQKINGLLIANSTVHRPVREQAIITAPSETRPSGCGHGCLHTELELSSREIVSKPTLGYDRQSPVTHSLTRSSGTSNGSTSLEGPSMVSNAPLNASQSTNSHPTITRHNTNSMSEQSARHHSTVSRVGYIRQQYEQQQQSFIFSSRKKLCDLKVILCVL